MLDIKFNFCRPGASAPVRVSPHAAGFDIFSCQNVRVGGYGQQSIVTGLCLEIPEGYYGLVGSRSGLAFNHRIDTFPGVIDSDFRGELSVLLFNRSLLPYDVEIGDRIAQLLVLPRFEARMVLVDKLAETFRGQDGFGSTGR